MIKFAERSFHVCIISGALLLSACGGEQQASRPDSDDGTVNAGVAVPPGNNKTLPDGSDIPADIIDPPTDIIVFAGCDSEGQVSLVDLLDPPTDGWGYVDHGLLVSNLWDPRLGNSEGLVPGREYTVSLGVRPTHFESSVASLSVLTGHCVENPPGMLNRELVSLAAMETAVTGADYQRLTHTFVYDGPAIAEQNMNAVVLVGMGPGTPFLVDDLTIVDTATGTTDISSHCYAGPTEWAPGPDDSADSTRYELYLPPAEKGLTPGQQYTLTLPVTPGGGDSTVDISVLGMTCNRSVADAPPDASVGDTRYQTVLAAEAFGLSGEAEQALQLEFIYDGPRIQGDIPSGLIVVRTPPGVELKLGEHYLTEMH